MDAVVRVVSKSTIGRGYACAIDGFARMGR
jgi:hypothetical protein